MSNWLGADHADKFATAMAPDLVDGYAINGIGRPNEWRTELQSVLTGPQGTAALCHECRAEYVAPQIFRDGVHHESCVVVSWDGNRHIRSAQGSAVARYEDPPHSSRLVCNQRAIQRLSLDDALASYRAHQASRHFLCIDFEHEGRAYALHAPARYINYWVSDEKNYLQPISGAVLFYESDRFFTAYVATHMTCERTTIEFLVRDSINLLDLNNAGISSGRRFVKGALRALAAPVERFLHVDDYHRIVHVGGNAFLYRYL